MTSPTPERGEPTDADRTPPGAGAGAAVPPDDTPPSGAPAAHGPPGTRWADVTPTPQQGWMPPAPRSRGRRAPRRRVVLAVLGAILLVAVVTVGMLAFLVGPRFARYDVLDATAVEQGVTRVVTDDWKRQVADVRCPADQRTRPGVAFRCTATVDGRRQEVPVVVADEAGTYEVGQPR